MKNFSFAGNLNKVWMLALVAFMVACSQFEAQGPDDVNLENAEELASAFRLDPYGLGLENARVPSTGTASAPKSQGGITPYIIPGENQGGNRTCDEVATAYDIPSFGISFEQKNAPFPENKATFTGSDDAVITATTDGTFVSWSIEVPSGFCVKYLAAIVKGSNQANVYFYEGDISSDSGLASPEAGQSGDAAGLSNLRFCYTLEKKPEAPIVKGAEECFEDGLVLRPILDGSIPEGYTLQWYTKNEQGEFVPVPGNDPKLDEVGSVDYYAAFVNGCSSEMSTVATLTIWALPDAPVSKGDQDEEACDGLNKLTASVEVAPGTSIVWYDAPTDGNVVTDPSLYYDESLGGDQTATFYAEAVDDETKCESATRTKVTLTLRPCPDDEPCYEWIGETAWAKGTRYVTRGNWATYSSKSALESGVKLLAGQHMEAGTVKLVGGVINIELNEGWRFKETSENVKIQHYTSTPPARNPAPGLFATKGKATTNSFSIPVPYGKFYGVHVDVEWSKEVECPVEEVLD